MRKWIIGGALPLIVVLILFFWPGESSLEYHKREYRKAMRAVGGQMSLLDRWRLGLGLPRSNPQEEYVRHRKALFDCAYLEERVFYLSNNPAKPWKRLADLAPKELPKDDDLWSIETHSNQFLVIRAERHAMKKWEEMVRKVDVP